MYHQKQSKNILNSKVERSSKGTQFLPHLKIRVSLLIFYEIYGLILLDGSSAIEATAKEWTYTEEMIKEMYEELEANKASGKSHEEFIKEALMEQEYTAEDIEKVITEFIEHGYTLEELEEIDKVPNHDRTLLEQDIALSANIFEVLTMPIPKSIPVLAFHSGMADFDDDDERAEYEQYRKDHIARLGENVKCVVIEGSTHSDIAYHRDYLKIISNEIDKFLKCTE